MDGVDVLTQIVESIPSVAVLVVYLQRIAGKQGARLDALERAVADNHQHVASEIALLKAGQSEVAQQLADFAREARSLRSQTHPYRAQVPKDER